MRLLVFNVGSSSLKFNLFDMVSGKAEVRGEFDRVGQKDVMLALAVADNAEEKAKVPAIKNMDDAFHEIPKILKKYKIAAPDGVVHRVAHGGSYFRLPTIIDAKVMKIIKQCTSLAPLHNPPALEGITFAQTTWKNVPHIAVFDTAFHQTIPQRAHTYAIPAEWRNAGVRRYGFHGSSHKYVAYRTSEVLGVKPQNLRIISCHLGNGASLCAIERGKSIDTTMGLTPLEGLIMGTRCGDLDPGVMEYLQNQLKLSSAQIMEGLYKHSGLKGLSNGFSSDLRDIEQEAAAGNPACQVAINVYAYRIRKYIGAYAAAMNGVDVIAFTGGVGENSVAMRRRICDNLGFMDVQIDEMANQSININDGRVAQIQSSGSMVRLMVLKAQEQWMLAQEARDLLESMEGNSYAGKVKIPVAVSARHCHLDRKTVDILFGKGYELTPFKQLKQPGNWASKETVDLIGPKGKLERVRILGPLRKRTQVEVSKTDTFVLGIDAPVRASGDVQGTPKITIRGLLDDVETDGLIIAERHIHMSTKDAEKLKLEDGDYVDVRLNPDTEFRNVLIRVSPDYYTEMHIDTDEANAARMEADALGEIIGGIEVLSAPMADSATVTNLRTRSVKKIRPIQVER